MKLILAMLLFLVSLDIFCHGNEDHSKKKAKKNTRLKKSTKKKVRLESKTIDKSIIIKNEDEFADKSQKIKTETSKVIKISEEDILRKKYQKINSVYLKKIKTIFKKSCFDCHGVVEKFPWYYKIPGVKHYIDYDISESKKHLEMTKDFPFISHASPTDDLKAIIKTIKDGSMPPIRYWMMHPNSRLTKKEIKIVNDWVVESIGILND